MPLKFGRLSAYSETSHPRLHLSPHLTAVTPPPSVDWYSEVLRWPMYLNDQIGDCTEAMVGHIIENTSTYGLRSGIQITDTFVLAAYERVSGYFPGDPSTDQGAVLQDVYGDWRKTGVGGHKALCFAQVNHERLDEIKLAVEQFGAVGLGITVTDRMMADFDAGLPWRSAVGDVLGGHAVPIVGYDAEMVYVVTWGRVQPMAWGVLVHRTDEAWVAVLPEWFSAAGVDPGGVDLYGLGEDFARLTGQPNPFPAPSPAPVPPGPVVTADEVLAASARLWLTHRHTGTNRRFADAVQTWIDAKGL
jgi:hypothetical protein